MKMKIAAYEVRPDEQKDFKFIAEKLGVELTETADNLTLEDLDVLNGAMGVTTLGRTHFDRALLTAVKERGVKYISTRTIGADHIRKGTRSQGLQLQLRSERRGGLHRHADAFKPAQV